MTIALEVTTESWPIEGAFTIARGSRTHAHVVVARVREGDHAGQGECVPYPRYGETVDGVMEDIRKLAPELERGLDRHGLQQAMPAGAARNALDCALWDLEAKKAGKTVAELLGLPALGPVVTAYTISLGTPEKMAADTAKAAERPLLKIKLGGAGDAERIAAVRTAAPKARLIVDANEGWSLADFDAHMSACAEAGVELIEQPLPAAEDAALAGLARKVPVCADESLHTSADIPRLAPLYDAVNIKLDKTGGLTEALALFEAARAQKLAIMTGCMVGTSLAMAPAMILAQRADFVDLDAPLLLATDRVPGLRFEGSTMYPAGADLWG
ncbi:N-acetyl-D-Glu racemase DgcA [Stappia indica]|uniref:N-acetyl-D-Glu racemase DgcA n=1 Tax=Stappia indica TaxID=538381 RepID=UPI001CD307C2|nr:N-acetyl-D-Glu racemase DgcA [Stappia indica]MCA1298870.1 L-Ala-D/L-Glu epimerase [Stappia indica]